MATEFEGVDDFEREERRGKEIVMAVEVRIAVVAGRFVVPFGDVPLGDDACVDDGYIVPASATPATGRSAHERPDTAATAASSRDATAAPRSTLHAHR